MIFFLSCLFCIGANSQSLAEVRENFHQAVLDPEQSQAFHDFLEGASLNTPTLKAYKATSEAMLARAVWNPFTKLAQVMKYADLMEVAVEEDSENIEVRFLRLAIEYNLPRFLGMSKHLDEDHDMIVENLSSVETMHVDPNFCHYIIYFLRDTMLCSEEEIVRMESALREVEEE